MSNAERRLLSYIEIDVPICDNVYGTSPCTASIPTTGDIKCFNTLNTCQDRAAYTATDSTIRFCRPSTYLPTDIEAIPAIANIQYTPGVVSLGGDLGTRATLAISFIDFPWSDPGDLYDKYPGDRSYDPYSQGTYWGKFRVRHAFMRGKTLRWIRGFVGDALEDMEERTYVIDSFDGPNQSGVFTIYARDILKIADNKRAQAPALNEGFLSADLSAGATSFTANPSGIGATYSTSGYLQVGGKEAMSFTRVGDVFTVTRGQLTTEDVDHDSGDRVQEILEYSGEDPADIIYDLLVNYANVPASYIPLATWQAETAAYLKSSYTAYIAEPVSVRDLVSELIEQGALALWWNDELARLELRVLRTISTSSQIFSDDDIIEDSLTVKDQPETRKTQVWVYFGKRNPLEPDEEENNYRTTLLSLDALAEADEGSPAIKKIFSRWIPPFGTTVAQRLTDIQIGRFKVAPRRISFAVYKHGGAITPSLGEGCQIQHTIFQDETGARVNVPLQITRLNPLPDRIEVEAEEMLFDFEDATDLADRVISITSNEQDFNLRTAHDQIYPEPEAQTGTPEVTVTCNIAENVLVGSSSTSTPAFDVGSWPAGIPITINVLGRIQGAGGDGADAGTTSSAALAGGDGGVAFYTRYAVDVDLGSGDGEIWGGGGGGGAASDGDGDGPGGGGGAGYNPGTGGDRQQGGEDADGEDGTTEAGGDGGDLGPFTDIGGDGGGPGLDGNPGVFLDNTGAGGSAGAAVDGVSYVTYVTTGAGDIRGDEVN